MDRADRVLVGPRPVGTAALREIGDILTASALLRPSEITEAILRRFQVGGPRSTLRDIGLIRCPLLVDPRVSVGRRLANGGDLRIADLRNINGASRDGRHRQVDRRPAEAGDDVVALLRPPSLVEETGDVKNRSVWPVRGPADTHDHRLQAFAVIGAPNDFRIDVGRQRHPACLRL